MGGRNEATLKNRAQTPHRMCRLFRTSWNWKTNEVLRRSGKANGCATLRMPEHPHPPPPGHWRRKRSVSPHNRLTWIHSWFCRCNRIIVRHHSQIASGRGYRGLDTFWGGVSLCTSLMLMHLCPQFPRAQVDKCHPQ